MAIPSLYIVQFTLQDAREFSRKWWSMARRVRGRTNFLMSAIKHPGRNEFAVALPPPHRVHRDADLDDTLTVYSGSATAPEIADLRARLADCQKTRTPFVFDLTVIPSGLVTRSRTRAQMASAGWFTRAL